MFPKKKKKKARMLLCGSTPTRCLMKCFSGDQTQQLPQTAPTSPISIRITTRHGIAAAIAVGAATLVLSAGAIEVAAPSQPDETLSNIPQTLSGVCSNPDDRDCKKKYKIQRPKSRKAESCTVKCVTTCIRGGLGASGEGPFNVRRPLIVFKDTFRSRKYCLSECSDICNLIGDGDDGP